MSLTAEYKRQFAWRDWRSALDRIPIQNGQKILDLGCGTGDISRELALRGARVVSIDASQELLDVAQKNCPQNCTFIRQDLRSIQLEPEKYDGLWCSFVAAYFTDLSKVFVNWAKLLKSKSWVCVTDIDDLLGHEPLDSHYKSKINDFYNDALLKGSYDFCVGRKLENILEKSGFSVTSFYLEDKELSFNGPASSEILQAWSNRFKRMEGLKLFLGPVFQNYKTEFLKTIAHSNHRSNCKVICCIGRRS